MSNWVEHVEASKEMGMSHRAAYESWDGPLFRLRRATQARLAEPEKRCGRCGYMRPESQVHEVVAPTPNGPADTMRIELCAACRRHVKESSE